ncbi:hypothetical protein FRB99_005501 [Tulasnella sp. 403]|nr:hypothetical protein FRB99_005501 [Tulasnella sp. 403]
MNGTKASEASADGWGMLNWTWPFNPRTVNTIQQEDLGSAADFTFVSSDSSSSHSRDPPPTQFYDPYTPQTVTTPHPMRSLGFSGRNPPGLSEGEQGERTRSSTIYPSDSVSNLQLRQTVDDDTPERLGRRQRSATLDAERERLNQETYAELAVLDEMRTEDDGLSERVYSPPPQRSRLEKIPTTSPVMMYPSGVRATVARMTP